MDNALKSGIEAANEVEHEADEFGLDDKFEAYFYESIGMDEDEDEDSDCE